MELKYYVTKLMSAWDLSKNSLIIDTNQVINQIAADSSIILWISELLHEKESVELYRDEKHGFILTAYIEKNGQYRIPHNHGNGWVIYSVARGEMEMKSYDQNLKQVNLDRLFSGDSRAYAIGEIHDTRCISQDVIILRFTSCDLKVEENEGRMNRFPPSKSIF